MHHLAPALLILLGLYGCANTSTNDSVAVEPAASPVATSPVDKVEVPAPAPAEPAPEIVAEQELKLGITAYENGQHRKSQQHLKTALSLGLTGKSDKVAANKYLAFMACANKQRDICRGYFRKALATDSKFELSKSEAGHPMWGSVFKEVKAEGKAKSTAKQ